MIRLRLLRLEATTPRGVYGRTLRFGDGLTVVHGPNTIGKSTCLMSVLYGLGLEGMLTAKHQVPLPHALTEHLTDGDEEVSVTASSVMLEIETGDSRFVTVRRIIKGDVDTRLIQTWEGRAFSQSRLDQQSTDYYVRDPGAAKREAGFHNFLARQFGWTLPEVPRYDGSNGPLYLEAIFPMLFIEQKRGWLGLQARMPTHLGIRDVQARVVEFLLKLDADDARTQRNAIDVEIQHLTDRWLAAHAAAVSTARMANGDAAGIPSSTTSQWPGEPATINVIEGQVWADVRDVVAGRKRELIAMVAQVVPTTGADATRVAAELKTLEDELTNIASVAVRLREEAELAESEMQAATVRAIALRRDLQRNKDAEKLKRLGSLAKLSVVQDRCPTCHQMVSGHLLPPGSFDAMSLEENIAFIEEMLATVDATGKEAGLRAKHAQHRLNALTERQTAMRAQIRQTRRALVQDDRTPSLAHVEGRVRIEHQIAQWEGALKRFGEVVRTLKGIHEKLIERRQAAAQIRDQPRSKLDDEKLRTFRDSFISQIREYGLRSLDDALISLDPHSYRPRAEGMPDLEFELSGSDLIRAIWAYYLALLETARQHQANHPGILIVDEPRQQGAEALAIAEMLRRASAAGSAHQQVIVASAQSSSDLHAAMKGMPFAEVSLDGWVLTRQP